MMFSWLRKGLRTGVLTTRYPAVQERVVDEFRGRPILDAQRCAAEQGCDACVEVCLPTALHFQRRTPATNGSQPQSAANLVLDYARCIMCGLCVTACPTGALEMTGEYELATRERQDLQIIARFLPASISYRSREEEDEYNG